MLFSRKGKLKREFDEKLVELMKNTRDDWHAQKNMAELSVEKSPQLEAVEKIAEAKYFYLFKEARERKIVIK